MVREAKHSRSRRTPQAPTSAQTRQGIFTTVDSAVRTPLYVYLWRTEVRGASTSWAASLRETSHCAQHDRSWERVAVRGGRGPSSSSPPDPGEFLICL